MVLLDSSKEVVALSRVKKVVACGGVVKIWVLKDIGPKGAKSVHDNIRKLPGVQAVTLVPMDEGESMPVSNL